jgi:hypothetical protein
MGRALIITGLILILLGILVSVGERLPWRPGQLPGDIVIRGKNSVFYFPIVTCILLSLLLTILFSLFSRR